jgi:hypothetical protein
MFSIIGNTIAADTISPQWDTLYSNVYSIICGLFKTFKGIVGPLAVLVFVIAGVQWIASRDDPGKRKAARDAMIAIIIGVLILQLIIPLITSIFKSVTGKDITNYVCS